MNSVLHSQFRDLGGTSMLRCSGLRVKLIKQSLIPKSTQSVCNVVRILSFKPTQLSTHRVLSKYTQTLNYFCTMYIYCLNLKPAQTIFTPEWFALYNFEFRIEPWKLKGISRDLPKTQTVVTSPGIKWVPTLSSSLTCRNSVLTIKQCQWSNVAFWISKGLPKT